MSEHSKIERTDATWNSLRGCTKLSPGCKHCYAETFAERFRGVAGHAHEQGFDLRLVPEKLAEPFQWSGPRTVFVNSMSDLFQPGVPDAYIQDVVNVKVQANWHTDQVLTKRSERLRDLLSTSLKFAAKQRHIWWGVSVEDESYGLPRIEHLRAAPAAVKFLSIEPLLRVGPRDRVVLHIAIQIQRLRILQRRVRNGLRCRRPIRGQETPSQSKSNTALQSSRRSSPGRARGR